MKFDVLGRDVDFRLKHLLLNLGALLAILIPLFLVGFVAAVIAAGGVDMLLAQQYQIWLVTALSAVSLPLVALVLLALSWLLQMKKDVNMCRSLASGYFALYAFVALVSAVTFFSLGFSPGIQQTLFGFLASLASFAAGAILLYLWLLIFLKPDKERITYIAPYALVFTIVIVVAGSMTDAAMSGAPLLSTLEHPERFLHLDILVDAVQQYLFALSILYFMLGKKIEVKAAYLFAGLYVAPNLLAIISADMTLKYELYLFAPKALALILLYLLAKYGSNNV